MRLAYAAALTTIWLAIATVPASGADELTKDDEKWLAVVTPLVVPGERDTFEKLSEGDRKEFRKIFWARRDPGPDLPREDNEFKADYLKRVEDADERFHILGKKGSQTDCGWVLLLLGEPQQVAARPERVPTGRRGSESWTYQGEGFADGGMKISFDQTCRLPRAGSRAFKQQLAQLAQNLIRHPALDYRTGDDGRLTRLVELSPKPSPATDLFLEPRQDFALAAETKLVMRVGDGHTYVAGLVSGPASGLTVREADGRSLVDLVIAIEALAVDDSVPQTSTSTIEIEAEIGSDDQFVASWPLTLCPSNYTVRLTVTDSASGKGAVTDIIVEAPDLAAGALSLTPLILFDDIQQGVQPDPKDYLFAFTLGETNKLLPHYGNRFSPSEQLQVIAFCYDAPTEEASDKASLRATFEIMAAASGEVVARSPAQIVETSSAMLAVGPIPLAQYEPGE